VGSTTPYGGFVQTQWGSPKPNGGYPDPIGGEPGPIGAVSNQGVCSGHMESHLEPMWVTRTSQGLPRPLKWSPRPQGVTLTSWRSPRPHGKFLILMGEVPEISTLNCIIFIIFRSGSNFGSFPQKLHMHRWTQRQWKVQRHRLHAFCVWLSRPEGLSSSV
jgi:hypothetical protein